jgi:hypothetical protein
MEYWNDGCGGIRPISLACPYVDHIIPIIQYSIIPCTKAELAFMRLTENVILSPPQAGEESRTPELSNFMRFFAALRMTNECP